MTAHDPAISAYEALQAADAEFDRALSARDGTSGEAREALLAADLAFARAVPTTAAGAQLKFASVERALGRSATGDALTEHGAELLALHLAALRGGMLRPHATVAPGGAAPWTPRIV